MEMREKQNKIRRLKILIENSSDKIKNEVKRFGNLDNLSDATIKFLYNAVHGGDKR